jgi:hypothetical protein
MFLYQLDAKLKGGFDFVSGNFPQCAGVRAQLVKAEQSIGVR